MVGFAGRARIRAPSRCTQPKVYRVTVDVRVGLAPERVLRTRAPRESESFNRVASISQSSVDLTMAKKSGGGKATKGKGSAESDEKSKVSSLSFQGLGTF